MMPVDSFAACGGLLPLLTSPSVYFL